jgi:hypothetical protein
MVRADMMLPGQAHGVLSVGLVKCPYSRRIAVAKKTVCPINRAEFRAKAKPVSVVINNVPLQAEVKEFSTGSLGWYLNGKTSIEIDGKLVAVQIGLNLTIVGSKELPQDEKATAEAVA